MVGMQLKRVLILFDFTGYVFYEIKTVKKQRGSTQC